MIHFYISSIAFKSTGDCIFFLAPAFIIRENNEFTLQSKHLSEHTLVHCTYTYDQESHKFLYNYRT